MTESTWGAMQSARDAGHGTVRPMRELLILAIHLLVTVAKLVRPGGARAVAAESLIFRHQLLISNRSRQRAPNLTAIDRFGLTWSCMSSGGGSSTSGDRSIATPSPFHESQDAAGRQKGTLRTILHRDNECRATCNAVLGPILSVMLKGMP